MEELKQLLAIAREDPAADWEAIRHVVRRREQHVYGSFKIGIINALPHELAAVQQLFGPLRKLPAGSGDTSFEVAEIVKVSGVRIQVVITNVSGQGTTQAAMAAASLVQKMPYIESILLVGIAAGQPSTGDEEKDVWLGDIVVADSVVQYDHVKREQQKVECRGTRLATPGDDLLATARSLKAEMEVAANNRAGGSWCWEPEIARGIDAIEYAGRPSPGQDPNHEVRTYPVPGRYRKSDVRPHLHIGCIGSANTLLKNEAFRDQLAVEHGTIAYEMEGAGVAIASGVLSRKYTVIRGICDYADMRKNNDWQRYAAVAAAAFCKVLLERI